MGNTTFPGRLKRAREAAGLTVAELAAKAGMVHSHVNQLENGTRGRSPTWQTVRRLAAALGVRPEELAG